MRQLPHSRRRPRRAVLGFGRAEYKGDAAAEGKIVEMLKTGGAEDHKKVAASDADLKAIAADRSLVK